MPVMPFAPASNAAQFIASEDRVEGIDFGTLSAFDWSALAYGGSGALAGLSSQALLSLFAASGEKPVGVQFNTINGTSGDDFLAGTMGDDTIDGREGNDTIEDGGAGNDTLIGGEGDDLIRIQRFAAPDTDIVGVNAGVGNDILVIDSTSGGHIIADMGDGDDTVFVDRAGTYTSEIILGAGSDTVNFQSSNGITILDFEAGDGGDNFVPDNLIFRANGFDASQNPFATGYLALVQDGNNVVLEFYENGGFSGTPVIIAEFLNTQKDDFTAANFDGYDPQAGGAGETLTGTEGDYTINGTDGADTINGLGGNDTIDGRIGNDTIDGGAGNDTITGGQGDDTIHGGEGDDIITDAFGANIIHGDGGNDTINITGFFGSSFSASPHQIFGGSGNDVVNYGHSSTEGLILDLGEGDDRINFTFPVGDNSLTLGLGQDIVDINGIQSISSSFPITITDFQTGDAGDQLVWGDFIAFRTGNDGDPDFNPFSYGEAELVQVGNDVHIVDGFTLVVFQNTQLGDFTTFNLGFDPNAPTAPGETFTGTAGRDFFTGTNRNDVMTGLGDDDSLEGRGGDDEVDGGDGNDLLDGGEGNDTLIGGAGNDEIYGRGGADVIDAGDGDDYIDAGIDASGAGNVIDAGAGNDTIVYSGPNDIIDGGEGFDTLEFIGTSGPVLSVAVDIDFTNQPIDGTILIGGRLTTGIENILYTGEYSNLDDRIIFGANWTDGQFITGGNGNDTLTGTNGEDFLEGGEGNDILTGLGGIDQIDGSFGDDTIDAGDGDDSVTAGDGNDIVFGGGGNDEIFAGAGNDTVDGGAGNDTIDTGRGIDIIDAGEGDDLVTLDGFEAGDDIDGGAGNDTLRIFSSVGALVFDFADISNGATGPLPVRNFETFEFQFTGQGDNVILGDAFVQDVELNGLEGNDFITGGAGNDTIIGGEGVDVLRGGAGDDEINSARPGFDSDQGEELYGEAGNDRLFGSGLLDGGTGNDFVSGSGELIGGEGDDSIVSFGDGDIIFAGPGTNNIALRGASATVFLEAGLTADTIDGGSGFYTVQATADNSSLQWTGPLEQNPEEGRAIVDGIDVVSDGGFANFRIVGTELNDQIHLNGFGTSVTIDGSAPIHGLGGNDWIIGSDSDDLIFGGDGNDQIDASEGEDTVHGGRGNDRVTVNSVGDVLIELEGEGDDTVVASLDYTIGDHVETLELVGNARIGTGSSTDNSIFGNALDNELFGLGGNDLLEGREGNDFLDGGMGDDHLIGGNGNDRLLDRNGFNILDGGEGDDTIEGDGRLIGGVGNDSLTGGANADFLIGSEGDDLLDGGDGDDTADYSDAFGPLVVDLRITGQQNTLAAGFDTLVSIERVIGTSDNDTITGNDVANVFTGGAGDDTLVGGGNVDIAVFSGDLSQYTIVQFTDRSFGVIGPDGQDRLFGIDFAQFDDQMFRLLPGTGVSVDFNANDPSSYQTAMSAIRDFDGNDLGGQGSWLLIGSIDVNGDGDVDHILVNDAIGRFATVGTAPDGLVYFEDHSWAGETRVAGIYIDPLVESGEVIAGSDFDSQRRFQNDLQIENINRVLGADDYDGDGIWEVYFALTDGTAYLRALMHADGNIRYANYQSEEQVRDYLTSNGYDENTFGDWFSNSTGSSDTTTFVNVMDSEKTVEEEAPGAPPALVEHAFEVYDRPVDEWQAEFFG